MPSILSQEKIFITGAGGFIGANLVRKLCQTNSKVHILLRKTTNPWRVTDVMGKVEVHTTDLLDTNALGKLLKRVSPTILYHFATYGRSEDQKDIEKMVDVNIKGSLSLLQASKGIDYKLFVNIGSSSEYGFKNKPMKETNSLEPTSFYAATKASQTYLCQVFAKEYDKPIVTLRPFSVYGPFEEKNRFIPTIMTSLIQGKPIFLTPGTIRRDFIFVDDFVQACLSAVGKGKKLKGKIINVGTGKEYSNTEVVKTLFTITKQSTRVEKGAFPKRSWDSTHWVADTTFCRKLLGWKPKTDLDKGLYKTYIWFEQNQDIYT